MASKAPNILFLMADQLAPQFLPAYGHKLVKAPHLTALAERGVVFDACYTNAPLCAPARYVMMSGRLPTAIGAWDNAVELSAEIPTFAHYLSALGYRTCLSGKMHFCGPDQLHGFQERLTTDVYPADFTWTPNWDEPEKQLDWYHNMEVVRRAGTCLRSAYLDYDDEVTFTATRYIFEHARRAEERPFCLVASFIHPHDPYITRPEYFERHREADIDMPATAFGAVPDDPHSARLRHGIGMMSPPPSEAEVRQARRAYYGSVAYIDDRVGEILRALEESGEADNTIVIFTGDHGDMLGERGLWFKMSWFEHSARIPLIVAWPKRLAPRRVAAACSQVDFLPTLVDLASQGQGFDYPTPLEGRSLAPYLRGSADDAGEAIGEYFAECTAEPVFMIRRGNLKYVACKGDPEQLYRLDRDPHERSNRAGDPAEAATIAALRAEAARRWDSAALRQRVVESQRRRRWLGPVMRQSNVAWDYQPIQDARQAYIRNHMPIYEIERRARFP